MSLSSPYFEAFIGLGSNLDEPLKQLKNAQLDIAAVAEIEEMAFSSFYASKPLGGPPDQPDYINAVMLIHTSLSAHKLLEQLQRIEILHGRKRSVRWGARTLDLDLLLYDQHTINEANLIIPHPEMPNRAFVLYPLADIASGDLLIPGYGHLAELLAACPPAGLKKIA